ncbi:protein YhfH [Bacillus sp. FJAT-27245]|nr:protein YhfH [Bacillus sp. FJAT-27245]
MLVNPIEFFRNLPQKQCATCGSAIPEQAESYLCECDSCLAKQND